jgi:hypothetical protein
MSQFDFIEQSSLGAGFVYKNNAEAFVYGVAHVQAGVGTGTSVMTINSVTDGIIQVGMTLTGITPSRTIASFGTFNGTTGTVNLSGTATWTDPTEVTAIGFIKVTDADYPPETVRGIVYLDGAYYVMTPGGTIYGSEIGDPYTWTSLNAIQTIAEPDTAVALFRQLNLIVAFCDYSTEFFYNAANPPPGSPLLAYTSAALQLGCASANSVAQAENTLFFMGKAKQKGRSIYKLEGTKAQPISNPFIDKLLDKDTLEDVVANCIKLKGHLLYVLTLPKSDITLVYDDSTSLWNIWTQLSVGASMSLVATEASWANGKVTITIPNHQIEDGTYARASFFNSAYNGNFVIGVPDANTITYELPSNPGVFSGGNISFYIEQAFRISNYNKAGNTDLVQDSTTGFVYAIDADVYRDGAVPIKYRIRTGKFDGGNNKEKFYKLIELVGDKTDGTAYVRYSNDDYNTWSKYRPVQLDWNRSLITRLGKGRRRAFEIINYDNVPIRLEALELIVKEGIQ